MLASFLISGFAACGCSGTSDPTRKTPTNVELPADGGPRDGAPSGDGESGNRKSNLREIMNKIGKGPNALSSALDQGLRADDPDWGSLQPKAAELAKLTAELGKSDPPRGSKESWSKLAASFAASATALDKAAQGKDLEAARAAQMKLGRSCMECHRQHRGGPEGGPGGFGGPRDSAQLIPSFLHERLKLSDEQKKELAVLQKEVDGELGKILTDDQKRQLEELRQGGGRGRDGRDGPGRRGQGRPTESGRDGSGRESRPGERGPGGGARPRGPEDGPPGIDIEDFPLDL
jgi:hypothetical protein